MSLDVIATERIIHGIETNPELREKVKAAFRPIVHEILVEVGVCHWPENEKQVADIR